MLIRRTSGIVLARALSGLALALVAATTANAADKSTLPGMTYSSIEKLPDWSGWWTTSEASPTEYTRAPPPLKPEDLARMRNARAQDSDPDVLRYCRPPQFTGYSGGFVDSVEFLFTPGRVTLTNEQGLIRRIYTDGRPVPKEVEATNGGTSVGRWAGATLVVETTGINPDSRYPSVGGGTPRIGKNASITERIALTSPNTLEIEVTTVAPDILTRTDVRKRVYTRAPGKTSAREISFCVDNDRSIESGTGKQRFDMTPPADLPPPPPPK